MQTDRRLFLRFKKLLSFVFKNKRSDFYRLKYKKAGFNPFKDFNSAEDIKKIPLLTKEELLATESLKLLFVDKKEVELIASSTGTTNEPLIFFHSYIKSPDWPPDALNPLKLKIKWATLFLFNTPNACSALVNSQKMHGLKLIGDISNLPVSLKLASKLKVDTIYTTPTLAIILKNYFENFPNYKKELTRLFLQGELVTPEKKRLLSNFYPNVKIFQLYGLTETAGALGFQCPFLSEDNDRTFFHLSINNHYSEIISPDTEKRVNFREKGELVVTNFHSLATPIIRYRTGDLVSLEEKNDCPCGSPGPLMQIFGRIKYDMVKVGGILLTKKMVEKPILSLKDYLKNNFEAHVYERFIGNKPKIKIILNLELKNGAEETLALKRVVEKELLENCQLSPRLNLGKAVEIGLFEPLQINFVQFSRSAKARQILILHSK